MLKRFMFLAALAASGTHAHAQGPDIPRTADGRPDFHGVWESRWRTPLERPDELDGPTMTAEEAARFKSDRDKKNEATNMNPPEDSEYDTFMPAAHGLFRTSQVVEPSNGLLPFTEPAYEMFDDWDARLGASADPEDRAPTERCIVGVGRAPMQIAGSNMFRRIVQTPDHVVILTEYMNEVRVIPIGAGRKPSAITSYQGDSVAHWEDDGLVVKTTNYAEAYSIRGLIVGPQSVVTERFSLTAVNEISYEFTVVDAALYAQPWRAQYILRRTEAPMWESSCHEGNHGLVNIMLGARMTEARAAQGVAAQPTKAGNP